MEHKNDIVDRNASYPPKRESKKKQGFFRSALVMIRNKQNEQLEKDVVVKPVTETVEGPNSKENWTKIVGSIRPLHIPDSTSPTNVPKKKQLRAVRSVENFDDIYHPPPSPTYSTASSGSGISQYASANDLYELEKLHSEVNDAFFDEHSADVMIDTKAEEFISRFYEQMRRQINRSRNPDADTTD
jgi:hypothetical protein